LAVIKRVWLGLSQVTNTLLLTKCKANRFEQTEWVTKTVKEEKEN